MTIPAWAECKAWPPASVDTQEPGAQRPAVTSALLLLPARGMGPQGLDLDETRAP